MSATSTASLRDRIHGCLLGTAVGDAVGAPYEGLTHLDIFYQFGLPDHLVTNPKGDVLRYTDDTEMLIGVAESLAEVGSVDVDHLVRRFVANYHPERGYGRGARLVLEAATAGEDYRSIAATTFPGGSLGNGAAMRVAPVGLLFHTDDDRVWQEAGRSAEPTHTHPVGIEGARIMALAVAMATRAETLSRKRFLRALLDRAETEPFQWALRTALDLRPGDSIAVLGSTLHADQSVVTAIMSFLLYPTDFNTAIGRVIALGDDTDTLAAMTGGLVGAFAGVGAIPAERIAELEDDARGRSHLLALADRLGERLGV